MGARETETESEQRSSVSAKDYDVAKFIEHRNGRAYPQGKRFSVKHIAYLYAYCRKHPLEIVAAYPAALSHADVLTALAYYYRNQETFDAEIAEDHRLNAADVLAGDAGRLPRMGLPKRHRLKPRIRTPDGPGGTGRQRNVFTLCRLSSEVFRA